MGFWAWMMGWEECSLADLNKPLPYTRSTRALPRMATMAEIDRASEMWRTDEVRINTEATIERDLKANGYWIDARVWVPQE